MPPQISVILTSAVVSASVTGLFSLGIAWKNGNVEKDKQKKQLELAERHKEFDLQAAKKSRLLDMYKVVYPARLEAAKPVMDAAGSTYRGLTKLLGNHLAYQDTKPAIKQQLIDMVTAAKCNEVLLGPRVVSAACVYQSNCHVILDTPMDELIKQRAEYMQSTGVVEPPHEAGFKRLTDELRAVLCLNVMDDQIAS